MWRRRVTRREYGVDRCRGSGETDLKSPMEPSAVIGERRHRILEAIKESVDEEGEAMMPGKRSWWVHDPWPETGQVGADLGRPFQETLQEGSCSRVLRGVRTKAHQRLKLTGPADERVEEEPQDRRSVLAAGQAEVR